MEETYAKLTPWQKVCVARHVERPHSIDYINALIENFMQMAGDKVFGEDEAITGEGTIEVMQDGFGFLRSSESNYLAGPDDIYVSPAQVKKYGLRTGDTVEGEIRAPKENERYFALVNISKINFDSPEKSKLRVNFDNLTPLYPTEKLNFDIICGEKDYSQGLE